MGAAGSVTKAFTSSTARRFRWGKLNSMPSVILTDDGFAICSEQGELTNVRWVDVVEIIAFKVDLLTSDRILLGFRVDDSGDYYQVDEEWPNYQNLVNEVESRFDVQPDWWRTVAFPAFATNLTTLWGESCPGHD